MHNFSSEISESDEEGELEEVLDIDEAWSNVIETSVSYSLNSSVG